MAWHESHDWPLDGSSQVTLRPTADGKLADEAADGAVSYTDRLDGAKRRSWKDASAVFRSEALSSDMLVNGAPSVDLVASSSADATKWVVYLVDEAPDGSWQRITHDYADSHTWKSEATWTAMEPGKAYRWRINLMPTAVVVARGHRVTLVIDSQDSRRTNTSSPCFSDYRGGCYNPSGIVPATSAGQAVNTVHVGADNTSVTLSWVDPKQTQKRPW